MSLNEMERLLQAQQDNNDHILTAEYKSLSINKPQKANKNATLQDFIDMIAKIVSKSMKKHAVIFKHDEGARLTIDPNKQLENPYIFFEVVERKPKIERKPRERETFLEVLDDKSDGRQLRIWGQKFSVILQFNFLACDYNTVNAVMNDFEDMIFNYTPYFKKNGVAEILFEKHFTDKNLDLFRQTLSVRSLQYYIEIEKLITTVESEITGISII